MPDRAAARLAVGRLVLTPARDRHGNLEVYAIRRFKIEVLCSKLTYRPIILVARTEMGVDHLFTTQSNPTHLMLDPTQPIACARKRRTREVEERGKGREKGRKGKKMMGQ